MISCVAAVSCRLSTHKILGAFTCSGHRISKGGEKKDRKWGEGEGEGEETGDKTLEGYKKRMLMRYSTQQALVAQFERVLEC